MNYKTMHPSEQISMIMSRIYSRGMTTTSGGNLSYKDEQGRIWVSPSSFDKAELHPEDIVCIMPDGSMKGRNRPTSEYKFHMEAMRANPEFHAVLHAHSIALMGYSFLREAPMVEQFPRLCRHIGKVGVAPYAMPGSDDLSNQVYQAFARGCSAAILENHGIVVGGVDLFDAYARFEEIEYCAETLMKAFSMGFRGGEIPCCPEDTLDACVSSMEEMDFDVCSPEECDVRRLVAKLSRRLYQQKMCLSESGSFSIRIDADSFIISQQGVDRKYMQPEDTVKIRGGRRERGKLPDVTVQLHQRIFREHPEINYIIMADAQHNLAYELAGRKMQCEVVPEAYLLIRELPALPCGAWRTDPAGISARLNRDCPALLFKNDCLLVTGQGWFDSYDRVEVADYNARSMGMAEYIGAMVPLSEQEIDDFSRHAGIK